MLPLSDAAEVSRLTSYDIVQLLAAGKLTNVIRVDGIDGLAALRFDPVELRLHRKPKPEGYRLDDAAKLLRITYATLLVLTQKDTIGPRLRVNEAANLSGGTSKRVLDADLKAFQREYISAGEICHLTQLHPASLKKILVRGPVRAVVAKGPGITPVYACEDLPEEILCALGDRTKHAKTDAKSRGCVVCHQSRNQGRLSAAFFVCCERKNYGFTVEELLAQGTKKSI